ncbi:MAG: KH domain-containing protein [Syntrophothermus sp.]
MKELVEFIAKSLVDHPEDVSVDVTEDEREVTLALRVAAADMGQVIGRQGRIAKAIRTVVKAAAVKDGRHVTVEIID